VNGSNATLREALRSTDPKVELAIANSLWAAEHEKTFKPDFLQCNQQYYEAEVRNIRFMDPDALSRINGWVNEATRGRIPTLVKPEDLHPDLIMILMNAVYFKGEWQARFDPAQTREAPFTLADGQRKPVPMMSRSGEILYLRAADFQAVSLPYAGEQWSMLLFLPGPESSLAKFAANLTPENWGRWMASLSPEKGELAMPRFRMEYETELKEPLTALGMGTAFSDHADFRRLVEPGRGPTYIEKVRHKTFLEVNEEGTEASAATSVHIVKRGGPSVPFKLVIDRPFFCALRENRTGTLLFAGAVYDPAK